MKKNITISLCMIAKNEEDVLYRCLNSVARAVDEIVIVDTGSTDKTKDIAQNFNAHIYDFPWEDDFSKARNFSFGKATKDYILWMDADDIMKEEDMRELIDLKSKFDTTIDSVTMNYVLEEDEDGNSVFSLRRNRLVKRANNYMWIGAVHEYLNVYGNIINSNISIYHKKVKNSGDRNLKIYENRLKNGEMFNTRDIFYYGNELYYNNFIPKAIAQYKKFLGTEDGWVEDKKTACANLADCFYRIGDFKNELRYSFKSFEYGIPRADFCCRVGYHFLNNKQYDEAIFWYSLATNLPLEENSWGLINNICFTWLPHIQLCVCYSAKEEYEKAYRHNKIAEKYAPNSNMVKQNKMFLEKVLSISSRL